MAYDETLAARIREGLGKRGGMEEKKMFGGLAFLLRGNMCVGVHGNELIVRVDPNEGMAAGGGKRARYRQRPSPLA